MKMAKLRWIERAMVSLIITYFCSAGIACETQNGSGDEIHNWNIDHSTARLTIKSFVQPPGWRAPDSAARTFSISAWPSCG